MAFLVLTRFLPFESLCRPMKAQLQGELAAAADDTAREEITAAFASREKALGKTSFVGLEIQTIFAKH